MKIKTKNKMSFSFIAIGDQHFKANNLEIVDLFISKTLEKVKRSDPDFVVLMGDMLHYHSKIELECHTRASKFIKSLCEITNVFVLIGNHELRNNKEYLSDMHPFHMLKGYKYCKNAEEKDENKKEYHLVSIIDKPQSFDICNFRMIFCPYIPTGRFSEALDTLEVKIKDRKPILTFCHQEFIGCELANNIYSTKGDKYSKEYGMIISGHIHNYSEKDNLIYVGTPYATTVDESDKKGIFLFKFHSDGKFQRGRIDLQIPRKKVIRLKAEELDTYKVTDKNIKLVVDGDLGELKFISKSNKLKELNNNGIKVELKSNNTFTKPLIKKSYVGTLKEILKHKTFIDILDEIIVSE